MYALGIDLGTTFTAAAVWRNGHAEMASLGSRAAVIPSVVLLREDETFLTGEGASRRGLSEPHRVAREFKRRLGDTTPILLGGVPYSAEALMARLLRSVVDEVSTREGAHPDKVCVSHPANWGPYKTDLLLQAVRLSGLTEPVSTTTEPEAAAVFYAQQQRVEPGAIVAVYDLGGGTFDAAVLRKAPVGFEILGRPEGIERLGGIDFDAAVFSHVARSLGGKFEELDEDDPTTIAAVARLREECVQAKEALSSDTDVSIPVLLPTISTEIRMTRAELEAMVRPALHDSIEALKRALRTANVTADQLHAVRLVGGSSRMPIVSQLVGAELGRPVAVDAHPKHAVALGAAWLASGALAAAPAQRAVGAQAAASVAAGPAPVGTAPVRGASTPAAPIAAAAAPTAPPSVPVVSAPLSPAPLSPAPLSSAPLSSAPQFPGRTGSVYGGPTGPGRGLGSWLSGRRLAVVAAAVAVLMIVAGAALAVSLFDDTDGQPPGTLGSETPTTDPDGTQTQTEPAVPLDEQCTDAIRSKPQWVCLTSATMTSSELTVAYESNVPFSFDSGRFHLHIYQASADGSTPPANQMGVQSPNALSWHISDDSPAVLPAQNGGYGDGGTIRPDAVKVCARIADSGHSLVEDSPGSGTFTTGNCIGVTRA